MTYSDFIKGIEAYYGKYKPAAVKAVVAQYLAKVPEIELPEIRKQLLLTASTPFGHVPVHLRALPAAVVARPRLQSDFFSGLRG